MKYYLIAGEASGDLHAANLMKSLRQKDPDAQFRFFGGDLMAEQGGTLVKHYREMAFMGFIPVLLNLRTIFRNMVVCKHDIAQFSPDVVILIDYPGFNLKIAKYVKNTLKLPTAYYISPKVWAWKSYRIKAFKKYIDRMLCILPFEVNFFRQHNYPVHYVGNPTVDAVAQFQSENNGRTCSQFIAENKLSEKPIVALLAGSRRQEIKDNLPTMLRAFEPYSDHFQAIVAGAPGIDADYYKQFMSESGSTKIVFGKTFELLKNAKVALVTSGTATLETALFGVPQVVCYKTPIPCVVTYMFEHFFGMPYISLVNLISGKTVVKEFFGKYFSESAICNELGRLLNDCDYRNKIIANYSELQEILGSAGASEKAAELVVEMTAKS